MLKSKPGSEKLSINIFEVLRNQLSRKEADNKIELKKVKIDKDEDFTILDNFENHAIKNSSSLEPNKDVQHSFDDRLAQHIIIDENSNSLINEDFENDNLSIKDPEIQHQSDETFYSSWRKTKVAERDRKEKTQKISLLIILLIFVAIFGGLFYHWNYEPTYSWSELKQEQKMKVLDGNLRFGGITVKFNEIYGRNSGVFEKLTSEQINLLMNKDTLDLNNAHNEFLQSEIFLSYQNLTENLKKKVQNTEVEFQGHPVVINSLLMNNTEKILKTLNSTQIVNLIKNQKLMMAIGQKLAKETEFYIERRFEDLKINSSITSADLIEISLDEKLILVSDHAGAGKSTTFDNLALEFKQKYPLKWIQYVDVNFRIRNFKRHLEKSFDTVEILSEIFGVKNLDLKVFKTLYKKSNVVIFWDGFHEISTTYTEFILKLTKVIKKDSENIQFIATRPKLKENIEEYFSPNVNKYLPDRKEENDEVLKENFEDPAAQPQKYDIQENFNCTSYKLSSFSKEQSIEFLTFYYAHKNLTENQREKAQKLIENIQEDEYELTKIGSPQSLQMLSEIELKDSEALQSRVQNFLISSFGVLFTEILS